MSWVIAHADTLTACALAALVAALIAAMRPKADEDQEPPPGPDLGIGDRDRGPDDWDQPIYDWPREGL